MRNTKISKKRQKSSQPSDITKYKVTVTNLDSNYRVHKKQIINQVRKVLESEKKIGQVDVILARDALLKKLNKQFAGKNITTDVLSFPLGDNLREDENLRYLGEVYVSLNQAKRQARDYQANLEEEVLRLVTHGTLHLLGYDHKTKNQAKIMRRKEEKYLYGKA